MSGDRDHMRRALRLAERGRGRVSPNPMVGAVLVRDGTVVGEGAHRRFGGDHAEAEALAAAGAAARGATLYVTLEPCAHRGHTPPCADAVIAAGVARVVCALEDPDPRVAGRGLQRLRNAGIDVEVGLCSREAGAQNAAFLKHRRSGRPLVLLKLGQSLDGCIATRTGASRWITSEAARRHAHRWRSWVDAVAVGAGTVLADDPELTVRLVRGRDPRPLVVDGRLRVSPEARIFAAARPILATGATVPAARLEPFAARGVEVWTLPDDGGRIHLDELARAAGQHQITSLLIEGGRALAAAALRDRVVDEVMVYVAPTLLGDGLPAIGDLGVERLEEAPRLEQVQTRRLGPDLLIAAKVEYPCSPD